VIEGVACSAVATAAEDRVSFRNTTFAADTITEQSHL
jgi:hypothetical protein